MPARVKRKTKSTTAKMAELAFAVPQVVAHRVTRMVMAGPVPSERDRKEFNLMVAEKNTAFIQAWAAMFAQSVRVNQVLSAALIRSAVAPSPGNAASASKAAARLHGAALGVFGKGLGPVHRKAVANARRLARTKLR